MGQEFEALKLENQLCFPLYACSREIVKQYKPYLKELDLTYTQYIAMLALWEHEQMNVRELGDKLHLDSGTLTPVLKKLEQKGYLTRKRDTSDERVLNVTLTKEGAALRRAAVDIPDRLSGCVSLNDEEISQLQALLNKVLSHFDDH